MEQKRIAGAIAGPLYSAKELYRVQNTINAIAASVDASRLSDLRKLPGVKAVKLLAVENTSTASASKGTVAQAPQASPVKADDPPGDIGVQVLGGGSKMTRCK